MTDIDLFSDDDNLQDKDGDIPDHTEEALTDNPIDNPNEDENIKIISGSIAESDKVTMSAGAIQSRKMTDRQGGKVSQFNNN